MHNKPDLVLHICCAPDEAWVVHSLYHQYSLHCFSANPNISPISEYELRLSEAKKLLMLRCPVFMPILMNHPHGKMPFAPYIDTPEEGFAVASVFFSGFAEFRQFLPEKWF